MNTRRERLTAFRRIWLPVAIFILVAIAAANQNDLLRRFGNQALEQTQQVISYLLQVSIWLSAAYLVTRLMQVFIWEGLVSRALGVPVPRLLRDVAACLIYAIAISGIIAFVFRQSVTGIWATSGVVSIVIGLALRNIILDIFVGLAINFDRPFTIGDFIMLHQGNVVGRVRDINWRTTRLETEENNTVIVPNSRMGDMMLTNFSRPDTKSEFSMQFSLDFAVPSDRALRVLTAAVLSIAGKDGILSDPAPKARIKGTSTTGVEYKVSYWIDASQVGPGSARHKVVKSVLDQLRLSGLSLAHGQQDLFYAPMPNRLLDGSSTNDRVELLKRIELFALLDGMEIESLAVSMKQTLYPAGSTLLKQGDEGESMFIVMEGLLYVLIDFETGQEPTRVGQIHAGEFLGEMSLLTGEPRTATINAATDTLVYEITKEAIAALFERRPELIATMSKVIAKRKLANTEAYARATTTEREEQHDTLARQIMNRIRNFFHSSAGTPQAEAALGV